MSSLTVTLVQTELHWENKEANLAMLEKKIQALQPPQQVVVLPEMFSTGFSMRPEALAETMEGPTVQWMQRVAATKKIILAGSLIIEEAGQYFNRLVWMLPNGQAGYYDKKHLFAFAEEQKHYTAGTRRFIASVNGWKIALMICYDLRFPVWARQQNEPGEDFEYDLLIYVANWPQRRSHAWKSLLVARAIENQSYVIGVNRVGNDGNDIYHSGDSMLIDPLGEIVFHQEGSETVFTTTLQKEQLQQVREKFQFWRDKDRFMLLERREELGNNEQMNKEQGMKK